MSNANAETKEFARKVSGLVARAVHMAVVPLAARIKALEARPVAAQSDGETYQYIARNAESIARLERRVKELEEGRTK